MLQGLRLNLLFRSLSSGSVLLGLRMALLNVLLQRAALVVFECVKVKFEHLLVLLVLSLLHDLHHTLQLLCCQVLNGKPELLSL